MAAWLHAQNATSCSITGTVTDPTGAVVPGVQVIVTNQATGVSATETSNGSGFYDAESLAPGNYSIRTSKTGFESQIVKDIHLDPSQRRGVDLKLQVGAAAATVTVEADAVAVQTESAELGGTVSEKEVANLMLNGRNFQTLALIVPGVSAASGANALPNYGEGGYLGQTEIIVGGTSIEKTSYSIDGLFDMDPNALIDSLLRALSRLWQHQWNQQRRHRQLQRTSNRAGMEASGLDPQRGLYLEQGARRCAAFESRSQRNRRWI
ncbi:MAG: carboxypeptidase-like regulatory domain-containing protein [Terracidiphilus sp.]